MKSPSAGATSRDAGGIVRLDRAAAVLAEAQSLVDGLRARVRQREERAPALGPMISMLQACQAGRPGTPAHAAALVQAELVRRCGTLALPERAIRPDVSAIVCASDADAAMAALRALLPFPGAIAADIVVADFGQDPTIALLAGVVRPLDVIAGNSGADACNVAALAARGRVVTLTSGAFAAGVEDEALVGGVALAALERVGILLQPCARCYPGLHLAVPRERWLEAGGLDVEISDGQGLELADLCLKLRLLGVRLVSAGGGGGFALPAVRSPWSAVAAFRARWGDVALVTR